MEIRRPAEIGNALVRLAEYSEREFVLVAPFMKHAPLQRILRVLAATVEVTCVTRWRADEVAAGISDLAVYDEITARPGAQLLLLPRLHAKYYRSDDDCLIGSANLTGRALGWSRPSNIELLMRMPAARPTLAHFESSVLAEARPATEDIRAAIALAAQQLQQDVTSLRSSEADVGSLELQAQPVDYSSHEATENSNWHPRLRHPEDLFTAYLGQYDLLSSSSRVAAASDLAHVDPPFGLSRNSFESWIGAALLQLPLINDVDAFLRQPQRFGAVRDLLADTLDLQSNQASIAWQTLVRWLLHFLPHRYARRTMPHSEIVGRVTEYWPMD